MALGYSLGKGRLTNNLGLNWNRSDSQLKNNFTSTTDIASQIGLSGLPTNPLFFGLPNLTLNQFTSVTEQQPNFQINQTIAATESTSWIHKKHNVRFGGDFRRVHNDLFGNTGNITGTYTFTGVFTEKPGTSGTTAAALLRPALRLPTCCSVCRSRLRSRPRTRSPICGRMPGMPLSRTAGEPRPT